jgi:hypothetical protein
MFNVQMSLTTFSLFCSQHLHLTILYLALTFCITPSSMYCWSVVPVFGDKIPCHPQTQQYHASHTGPLLHTALNTTKTLNTAMWLFLTYMQTARCPAPNIYSTTTFCRCPNPNPNIQNHPPRSAGPCYNPECTYCSTDLCLLTSVQTEFVEALACWAFQVMLDWACDTYPTHYNFKPQQRSYKAQLQTKTCWVGMEQMHDPTVVKIPPLPAVHPDNTILDSMDYI